MRGSAGIALAAVVPDQCGKRAFPFGLVEKPYERQIAALERDALLAERRRGLLRGDACDDRDRRDAGQESRLAGHRARHFTVIVTVPGLLVAPPRVTL